MSIGTRTKPEVLVLGFVTRTREFKRKLDGVLLGSNVDVDTDGGGVSITYWLSDGALVPSVGQYAAVIAGVDEGREAQLVHLRDLTPGDLDLIGSNAFGKKG